LAPAAAASSSLELRDSEPACAGFVVAIVVLAEGAAAAGMVVGGVAVVGDATDGARSDASDGAAAGAAGGCAAGAAVAAAVGGCCSRLDRATTGASGGRASGPPADIGVGEVVTLLPPVFIPPKLKPLVTRPLGGACCCGC
jgi:hypothetical protein